MTTRLATKSASHAARGARQLSLRRPSATLFEGHALDRLTRVRPLAVLSIFLPTVLLLTVLAFRGLSAVTCIVVVASGYVSWTLFEYWVHRVVFHLEPSQPLLARLHWMAHGHHHTHPTDSFRLFFPLVFSLPVCGGFVAFFFSALGPPFAWAVSAGFIGGYLLMDLLHFSLHTYHPKSLPGRFYELHMRHHFENHECGFGVSAPWWDRVFGTHAPGAVAKHHPATSRREFAG